MHPEKKSGKGGARPGAGRKPKLGTVQWGVRTSIEAKERLQKEAKTRKLTPGDIITELVNGPLDKFERAQLNAMCIETIRGLWVSDNDRSTTAESDRRQTAIVNSIRLKLLGKTADRHDGGV